MDPNIKWEETEAFNIGLDFGFFDQRLTGAIDWYDKSTEDLLFTVPVAALQQLVQLRDHQRRHHAQPGHRVQPQCSDAPEASEAGSIGRLTSPLAKNNNELTSITPSGRGLKILVGDVAGGVGTRIQVLTRACR